MSSARTDATPGPAPGGRRMSTSACPCGSGRDYPDCCGVFLDGSTRPPTAEQLMRSRYSAYVRGRADYLLATWHPSTRPAALDLAAGGVLRWLGLEVRATEAGGPDDTRGTVEFVARAKRAGRAERLHERSRFVREAGQWYYLGGEPDPPRRPQL